MALISPKSALLNSVPDADDEIDPETTDAAAPFLVRDEGDVLDEITFGGDPELKARLRAVCEEFRDVFSREVSKKPARVPEYNFTIDFDKWRVQANRGPPRIQSAVKQAEILKQITSLLALGIIV